MKKEITILIFFLLYSFFGLAQKVVYSEPDREDSRQTEFEIIGKVSGNIMVYKSNRSSYTIVIMDMDMKQKEKVKLDFLPDRIINADFVAFPDYCYIFYQYQKKNVVYAMGARINGAGKLQGKPMLMDTTEISFLASNKIYSVINSEDKQHIDLFKINSKNNDRYIVTTMLFTKDLLQKQKIALQIDMPESHDFLTEFLVDNEGDFTFLKAVQEGDNDKVQDLFLISKKADSATASTYHIDIKKQWLDDVRLKADNYNRHYLITSFFSKSRRGNIDGMFTTVWDKATDAARSFSSIVFDDQFRNDAKGDNGTRTAFNDYSTRNIIVKKDGGFILAAESFFSTGRGGYNRYDNLYGSPFSRSLDYYSFGPLSYGYPWYRYNSFGQSVRYNAQNIAVFSFDSTGQTNWSTILDKSQYDDETDSFIGYSLLNTGDQLYFLFNQQERRLQLLAAQSVLPDGNVVRSPTLRNMDQGYDFMARYGKQTGLRQIIFPCIYRNYLCFARLEL